MRGLGLTLHPSTRTLVLNCLSSYNSIYFLSVLHGHRQLAQSNQGCLPSSAVDSDQATGYINESNLRMPAASRHFHCHLGVARTEAHQCYAFY